MEKNKNFEFVAGALAAIICTRWVFPVIDAVTDFVTNKIGSNTGKIQMDMEVLANQKRKEIEELGCDCDCQTNAIGFNTGDVEELYEDESEEE